MNKDVKTFALEVKGLRKTIAAKMVEDANVGYHNYIYHDSRNMNVVTDYRCG